MYLPRDRRLVIAATLLLAMAGPLAPVGSGQEPRPAEGWKVLKVPGNWEQQGNELVGYNGFAWYRCYAKVPDTWTGRTLYADSLVFAIQGVADAHEVYVNGIRIGSAGSFPPKFASGKSSLRRYKVQPGLLRKGEWNVLAVRVFNQEGPGGMCDLAPSLGSYEHEIKLIGHWEFRTGDDVSWALKSVERDPGAATYSKIEEASFPLGPTEDLVPGDRLSPAESIATMKTLPDLAVVQSLAEPDIAQPIHISFDDRGRMWVAEYRQYPYPAGLNMVSRNKYYRAVYDAVPAAPPDHVRGRDRISIHEDVDGDGIFEKHRSFVDGLNIATCSERGRGGVWILNPPYLLFYPDANGDDVPDGPPIVHLEGFGLEDTHSATNSLTWGPDGWLYSTQGSNTVAHVKIRGVKHNPVMLDGPGVWRYHPALKRFEVFAEGGGNAFGLELDSAGRIFSGHNGSDTRGFHYIQGGFYDKGTEAKYMPVSNTYAFQTLPMMAHAKVKRFTHSIVRYEAGGLPEAYRNTFFCIDPLNNHVMVSQINRLGSTFGTVDRAAALESTDRAFRPVAITQGPDGNIYVADFYEYYIAHGQHFQGQIDPSTGRIYRITHAGGNPDSNAWIQSLRTRPLAQRSSQELVEALGHPNRWFRQTALRILADRQDRSIVPQLLSNLKQQGQIALESLWALEQLDQFSEEVALTALQHTNPQVQVWGIRLIGDRMTATSPQLGLMASLAKSHTDLEVVCQLAASSRRLPATQAIPIIRELLAREDIRDDRYLPLMVWWAVESKCSTTDAPRIVEMLEDRALWSKPLMSEKLAAFLMRRFASTGSREDLVTCARLIEQAPEDGHVNELTRGFMEAFRGRSLANIPPQLAKALARTPLGKTLPFRVQQQDSAAIREALTQISERRGELKDRINLIEVLADVDPTLCETALLSQLDAPAVDSLQVAALTTLQRQLRPELASDILRRYPTFSREVAESAQTLLSSRTAWTVAFLEAVDRKDIDAKTVSIEMVRKMAIHSDSRTRELIQKLWGESRSPTSEEMKAEIAKFMKTIAAGTGNPYAGRAVFDQRCGKCHMMFGLGGKIGPDLTGAKRDDLSLMLLSIVNPSAEIREGFESYLVETADGRVLTGFLVDQDRQVVTLRSPDGQTLVVSRDNIDDMQKQSRSIMPENLLKDLGEIELRDLFAYLRSSQPGR